MSLTTDLPSSQLGLFIAGADITFSVESHPIPIPGIGEVLIKVNVAAVNPADCAFRESLSPLTFNLTPGSFCICRENSCFRRG